ncbi:MAG: hypothetical protein M5T52_24075 [Ignavibacteriaceae bacterium]|nr:hypothetical protein [Ignavibacteriaceae bacterium]
MKYKIKNSDIFINGKIISEGSEVELTPIQIQGLEYLLIPIESASESNSEPNEVSPEFISGSASQTENEKTSKKNKGNKK